MMDGAKAPRSALSGDERAPRRGVPLGHVPTGAALLLAVGLLAGCGGGSGSASPTSPTAPAQRASGGGGQGRAPGVSGVIAAVQGTTLQVQGNNQQTAVTYTAGTSLRRVAAATLADVRVGSCVTVRAAEPPGSGGAGGGSGAGGPGTGGAGAPGTGAATVPGSGTATGAGETAGTGSGAAGELSAAAVEVSAPVNGTCQGAGLGGVRFGQGAPGAGGSGAPSAPRSRTGTRAENGSPTQGNRGNGVGRGGVTGMVTAVDRGSFVVRAETRGAGPSGTNTSGASATGGTGGGAPATETVRTTSATTYAALVPAAAADLTIGRCATALGPADQTGAVAATSIVVREPVGGSCAGGFGGAPSRTPGTTATGG